MDPLRLSLSIIFLLLNVSIIQVAFISCKIIMSTGNGTDRLSLLAFKNSVTKDPLGVLSSWNDSVHHCQWHGVTCGRRNQRVTKLNLMSQKLVGSIAPQVGNLSFLLVLNLMNNTITYIIPPELGRLRRLRYLLLNNNSMSGVIPTNISGCPNLLVVSLHRNQLEGVIPVEIGYLPKLEVLYLDNNILTGAIPSSLGNMSFLKEIATSHNILSGNIPGVFGKLEKLTSISMRNNSLTGIIPLSVLNLSALVHFDLAYNYQIQGSLPPNLGNILPNIEYFSVAFNNFTGVIPASISNATNLVRLFFAANKLTGKMPLFWKMNKIERLIVSQNFLGSREPDDLSFLSSLTNASNLFAVAGNLNNFGGTIPMSIGNLSTLQNLYISDNHITGGIPKELFNLVHFQRLHVQGNLLTSSIPHEIGKLRELRELDFSENAFDGNIPSSIGNLTMLNKLYLQHNNLEGTIPSSLGNCLKLLDMDLSQNNLIGKIPADILRISSLSISLLLSDNGLSGPLPTEVGSLKHLAEFDISRNVLWGEIPSTLGSCLSLEVLSMEGNNFQRIVPNSLSGLKGLRRLDLSCNNLSGSVPNYLEGFDLIYLNLSFNHFDGAVPTQGIFKNSSSVFVNGNSKLCGGVHELELPRCNIEGITLKLSISIVSGVVGLGLILSLLFFYWSKRSKKHPSLDSPENSFFKASYQIILKATDGFSSSNMIGAGGFGSVYKGILDDSETTVAIKVLNLSQQGASKSFTAECIALKNIRHRNLVKVITACSGFDYQGNDFKALVYEFIPNDNLERWLHQKANNEIHEKLNFLQRLNVAIDVASALDHLHHGCYVPIVHCDLKPSNVLLDNEMIAHVGDFGLVRFIQEATQISTTDQASSIGVRGTIGYTAPEYGMGSKVSTNGDVYSYGILVLEMFTGKRPTDEMFKDRENLHNHVKSALPDRVTDISDPDLLHEIGEEDANAEGNSRSYYSVKVCIILIFRIAIACSSELARERMNMREVVAQLHSIRDKFTGNGTHGHRISTSTYAMTC